MSFESPVFTMKEAAEYLKSNESTKMNLLCILLQNPKGFLHSK
ncbi:hypothetical protein SAMN04490355_106021 [Pelosinus propionicus DSM 13327]|uniref:Uncharacterized protein n=1 Tax=Pelosinus propionicus DSM 13327 TaxID=1123291 RepID=A0A1I4PA76_9FIRM|nr:hypothetical protein SAMN04490355_106021 [Pelosinus propionicus DSM 13327]